MVDKVLCPYCGAEMKLDRYDDGYAFGAAYYVCQECGSTSPTANTEAAALAAAQARYLPPNRPLTLDEVKALETDNWMCTPAWVEFADCKKTIESGQIRLAPNVLEGYGRDFRVWLRKPTQAEMDAAGWGDVK